MVIVAVHDVVAVKKVLAAMKMILRLRRILRCGQQKVGNERRAIMKTTG